MSTSAKGKLVVISGPSGTGKSTVCRRLAQLDASIQLSVSATTRPPRKTERNGEDYYFLTRKEFEERIARGEFAEYAEYAGNLYGTPRQALEEGVARGKTIVMDIDVQGAAQVLRAYPDAVTIFLEPPDFDELLRRLNSRNTDSPEAKQRRIRIATQEMGRLKEYRYQVVNDDLAKAVRQIYGLITGKKSP